MEFGELMIKLPLALYTLLFFGRFFAVLYASEGRSGNAFKFNLNAFDPGGLFMLWYASSNETSPYYELFCSISD